MPSSRGEGGGSLISPLKSPVNSWKLGEGSVLILSHSCGTWPGSSWTGGVEGGEGVERLAWVLGKTSGCLPVTGLAAGEKSQALVLVISSSISCPAALKR